jgi:hypothetical protein
MQAGKVHPQSDLHLLIRLDPLTSYNGEATLPLREHSHHYVETSERASSRILDHKSTNLTQNLLHPGGRQVLHEGALQLGHGVGSLDSQLHLGPCQFL